MLEEHLAVGWEYDVEIVIDAPFKAVAPCVPRSLGRLEPIDPAGRGDVEVGDAVTRLTGSTSNPWWYAEQLARIPASYRIVKCPELREAVRGIGQRLLAAGGGEG